MIILRSGPISVFKRQIAINMRLLNSDDQAIPAKT